MHVQPPRVRNKNLTKTLPYCHVARLGANKVPFAKGTLFVVVPLKIGKWEQKVQRELGPPWSPTC